MATNGYVDATTFLQCQMIFDPDDDTAASLYAGIVCTSNGGKVKIGVFTDQYCTSLDSSKNVDDYLVDNDGYNMKLSHAVLKTTYDKTERSLRLNCATTSTKILPSASPNMVSLVVLPTTTRTTTRPNRNLLSATILRAYLPEPTAKLEKLLFTEVRANPALARPLEDRSLPSLSSSLELSVSPSLPVCFTKSSQREERPPCPLKAVPSRKQLCLN
jgi:hypothetical protein